MVVEFIDAHKDPFGVEPICRVLREHDCGIAPSTYYAAKTRRPSARTQRDEIVLEHIRRVHGDPKIGRGLYGYRKVHAELRREQARGEHPELGPVPRCQVERLMRANGLRGARRDKRFVTTRPDSGTVRPPDRVNRDFTASKPNELWVVDFTYVPTWSGTVFTALVSDVYSRRIVGWRTKATMPTELPLDALEMALWTREQANQLIDGLIHHSDAGTQYTAIAYSIRLAEVGALASIGTVGDCFDNAVIEAFWGRMQVELLNRQRWRTRIELANAIFEYLEVFHNRQRRHTALGMRTPIEYERIHHDNLTVAQTSQAS